MGKTGTVPITQAELLDALGRGEQHATVPLGEKVTELRALEETVERWRSDGEVIGFTNGCFDLLHAGHVSYLDWAAPALRPARRRAQHRRVRPRAEGRGPAGQLPGRRAPRCSPGSRRSTRSCSSTTRRRCELIVSLRPDVLVKGSDYDERDIVGAPEVRSWGGRVLRAPVLEGYSTTDILGRIGPARSG